MIYNPHDYQRRAIDFIIEHPRCALWLDMGLGKTVSTLTALDQLLYNLCDISKVLVIAPKSVALNTWTSERNKWDHLSHITINLVMGTLKQRVKALEADADIYVIGRDNTQWLVNYYIKQSTWPFDCIILDESSSFKNAQSKRYKALRQVMPMTRRIVELTGTPSPNGLEDLWAQIYLLDHGQRLGAYISNFRRRWFVPGARNGAVIYNWYPRRGAQADIARTLSDITLSMTAEDYLKMPDLIDAGMSIVLPELDSYKQFARDCVMELDGEDIVATTAVALTNKLLQYASGAVYDGDHNWHQTSSAKIEALCDIAESTSDSLLIMYNYKHELDRIQAQLPEAVKFAGEPEILERWNHGDIRIMCCHPASVSYGLNLQAGGHIIIWYSPTYNLEQYQQANARLYRQGQTKPVLRYHLTCKGTIDELVLKALQGKDDIQDALITNIKQMQYEISLGQ